MKRYILKVKNSDLATDDTDFHRYWYTHFCSSVKSMAYYPRGWAKKIPTEEQGIFMGIFNGSDNWILSLHRITIHKDGEVCFKV